MTADGERTNWVYAGIGVALVATLGCGFLWLNHRADAWGQELFYESLGRHNQEGYDPASAGLDGEFGTADDIANWAEDPEP